MLSICAPPVHDKGGHFFMNHIIMNFVILGQNLVSFVLYYYSVCKSISE